MNALNVHEGGCHCGRVRFRVSVRSYEALDCNCSVCFKKGLIHLIVPKADFELVRGADELTTYRFGTGIARHTFCKHCGVQPFYTPRSHPNHVDVNVRCLDGQLLDRFTIESFDGANWERAAETLR